MPNFDVSNERYMMNSVDSNSNMKYQKTKSKVQELKVSLIFDFFDEFL